MKKSAIITFVLVASASSSLHAAGDHAGGHGNDAHWMSPPEEQQRPNPVAADASSIEQGAKLFQQMCASCHGANAEGDGPAGMALSPRPTNLRAMSGGHPDGDFAWKIKNGRGAMPAWGGMLADTQVWDLVNYIQSLGKSASGDKADHHDHSGHAH